MRNVRKTHALSMTLSGGLHLRGMLDLPDRPAGLILQVCSTTYRRTDRDAGLIASLRQSGLGTLVFELASEPPGAEAAGAAALRLSAPVLAASLTELVDWARASPPLSELRIGLLGSGTGAAAALICAADRPRAVGAVVCQAGRPDLAGDALPRVQSPVLLISGHLDEPLMQLHRLAAARLAVHRQVAVIAGAGHLFREAGAMDKVAALSGAWFHEHLRWSR